MSDADAAKADAYGRWYLSRFRLDAEAKRVAYVRAEARLAIAEAEFASEKMVTGEPDGIPPLLRGVLRP